MTKKTEDQAHGKAQAAPQKKGSSPDALTKSRKKGDIELSDDELKAVAGGLKIDGVKG